MSVFGAKRLGPFLASWTRLVCRRAAATVGVFALLTGALAHYALGNLGINTDTTDMISDELPWRRTLIDFRDNFPQLFGTLVIVIDGDTVDLADDSTERLVDALANESVFTEIHQPGGGEFFRRHGLLFLGTDELETLADRLADAQPFLSKASQDLNLSGLFSLLSDAISVDSEELGITVEPVFGRLALALEANGQGRFHQLSWHEIMLGGEATVSQRRRFIVASPRLEFSQWLAAREAIETVRKLSAELSLDPAHGVRIRLTGNIALEHEELKSVSQGAGLAGALALIMVTLILFTALRSTRLVLVCVLTLLGGLIATGAFAAVAVGHLNLISIAFAVLYIGLGVDFAIHYVLRYRELLEGGCEQQQAVVGAAGDVGASLVLCAATTSLGFYAFFPTAFAGVSELGLISGTGMFIGLAYTLSLLPALLTLMPLDQPGRHPADQPIQTRLFSLPAQHARPLLFVAVILGVGSLASIPFVEFDSNPLNLRDPGTESVQTFHELLADEGDSPLTLSVLVPNAQAAAELAAKLGRLEVVNRTLHLGSFVPGNQDAKLNILHNLRFILGPDLYAQNASTGAARKVRPLSTILGFSSRLEDWLRQQPPGAWQASRRLSKQLKALESRLDQQHPSRQELVLNELELSLLGALPGRLERLRAALSADRVSKQGLPASLVSRWRASDGRYRVEIFPASDISDPAAAQEFVSGVHQVAPGATGIPVIQLGAGRAVVQAFQQAFAFALILISTVLIILLRSLRDTLLIVTPLLLAAALTAAASVVFSIPFNFANIIALPLLLGVGVDNGIHMVYRARSAAPMHGNLLRTSTARAVLYSGLTTTASFGNLAFSQHIGTASMGQLLSIGMLFTLICTLVLLPALLAEKGQLKHMKS